MTTRDFGILGTKAATNIRMPGFSALDRAAAIAAAALITVAAAMPQERDAELTGARAAGSADFARALPGRETAIGAYLGAPYHYPSDFKLTRPDGGKLTLKDVEWYTRPFDNPLYYGARVQRWFENGRTGTMIDFLHSKAYSPFEQTPKMEGTLDGQPAPDGKKIGDLFKKLEFTHGHNMLTFNGLMRFANFSPRVLPYVGIGAGVSLPHSEMHYEKDPARTYEYQYTGPTAQVLFGLEFRTRTGAVFLEYKFTIADYRAPVTHRDGSWLPLDLWAQFSRWRSGEAPPGGWGETRLSSHQVIGGFLARFPAGAQATAVKP